ncbi:hypothetical protein tb265_43590 [Gemmatimonadetes bacterium T265]|nr:hypothetical protein tb265_43590 [Gemmatimonadetes bacterium T265]
MLCILYVIALGIGLGGVGLLVERSLPSTWPRRWVWCAVIALSIVVPGFSHAHHTVTIGVTGTPPIVAGVYPVLSPAWWAGTASYDAAINRFSQFASTGLVVWGLLSAAWVASVSRRAARARAADAPDGATVVDDVPVVVTGRIGPATVGLVRSRVLLPRWVLALPAAQRRYIVRHEEEHRRAHDARLLGLASLALLLAPWNLALGWQLRRLHLAVETDCDRRVVRALGDARAYGALLLHVAEAASRESRFRPGLQPAFVARAGMLERRLTVLLRPTTRGGARRAPRLLAPLLACGLLAGLLSLPHPVPAGHHTGAGGKNESDHSANR